MNIASTSSLIELETLVSTANTVDGLHQALSALDQRSKQIDAELKTVVQDRKGSQERYLTQLDLVKAQFGNLGVQQLTSRLTETAYVASRLSNKVKQLDTQQDRVRQSMTYLDHVLELRRSIAGVGEAMSHRAWETAAGYIHTARSVPQEILEGSFALAMVPTSDYPDAPAVTLELATGELTQIFVRDFKQATESKDMPNVTRYFKLFPLIGQETAGLDIYSRFISGIISDQSRQLMTTTTTNQHDAAMFYAVATSRLFENIATIAAQHAPVVSRHYGPGRMLYVIDKIQDQADLQGGLIIDTFWDQRGLDRILNDIRNYAFPYLVKSFTVAASGGTVTGHVGPSRTGTPMLNDDEFGVTTPMANNAEDAQYLKSIGGLINETTVMLNRWMLYCKFLALHWPEYAGDKANNTDNDNKFNNNNNDSITLIIPKLIKESNYAKKISTKLAPFYDTLMTFFFRRSVEKAFQLDDAPPQNQDYTVESPLVTSVVDDVMYIFSSMMHQSLSTGDLALVRVTLGNIRRVLESDYIGLLQRRLRDGNPRNMVLENVNLITFRNGSTHGRFAGISLSDESKLRKFLINMNNLAVTGNYIDRILLNVMGDLGDKLPFSDDASQVSRTLDALAKSVKARADELITEGLQIIYNQLANPRLRTLVQDAFSECNYLISTSSIGNSGDRLCDRFAIGWEYLMSGFRRTLAPEIQVQLTQQLATSLARILEKRVWALEGRVNELGAIGLDRDISRIIALVTEGRYRLRDKFVRVAQQVMIVGFDDMDDEEGINWALNEAELARARRIRVDRQN